MPDPITSLTSYVATEIQVLSGLEAVLKRPTMYVGSESQGTALLRVYFKGEFSADAAPKVMVFREPERIIIVDDAFEWDVAPDPLLGRSRVEQGMRELQMGGCPEFGLGLLVALSSELEFRTFTNGSEWRQTFVEGRPKTPFQFVEKTQRRGYIITFDLNMKRLSEPSLDLATLRAEFPEVVFQECG